MEQQNQNQAADTEFSRCAVPADQRKTYFSLTIVWTGFVFVITSMMAGGGLAAAWILNISYWPHWEATFS